MLHDVCFLDLNVRNLKCSEVNFHIEKFKLFKIQNMLQMRALLNHECVGVKKQIAKKNKVKSLKMCFFLFL